MQNDEKRLAGFKTFNQQVVNIPKFSEVRGQNWVSFGEGNLYPEQLIDLYNKSAMHRTCLSSKQDGVYGEGLETKDPTKDYLLNRASNGNTWNEVFWRVINDYTVFSGFALNIIWGKTGEKITDMYHIDFSKVRSGNIDPKTDEVEFYYVSSNWKQTKKYKPIKYHTFDSNPEVIKEYPNQILYFFNYSPGNMFYPIPDYAGAINDIQVDIETASFHVNNLRNGLAPSMFISLNNGIPTPEERQDVYDNISSGFGGSENAGKFFLAFSPDKEHAPEVVPITNANDSYYTSLEQRITSRILTAHRISSPLLLGIRETGGGLGSNKDELITAYAHFISTVIAPYTASILTVLNYVAKFMYGEDLEIYVEPKQLFDDITNTKSDEVVTGE